MFATSLRGKLFSRTFDIGNGSRRGDPEPSAHEVAAPEPLFSSIASEDELEDAAGGSRDADADVSSSEEEEEKQEQEDDVGGGERESQSGRKNPPRRNKLDTSRANDVVIPSTEKTDSPVDADGKSTGRCASAEPRLEPTAGAEETEIRIVPGGEEEAGQTPEPPRPCNREDANPQEDEPSADTLVTDTVVPASTSTSTTTTAGSLAGWSGSQRGSELFSHSTGTRKIKSRGDRHRLKVLPAPGVPVGSLVTSVVVAVLVMGGGALAW